MPRSRPVVKCRVPLESAPAASSADAAPSADPDPPPYAAFAGDPALTDVHLTVTGDGTATLTFTLDGVPREVTVAREEASGEAGRATRAVRRGGGNAQTHTVAGHGDRALPRLCLIVTTGRANAEHRRAWGWPDAPWASSGSDASAAGGSRSPARPDCPLPTTRRPRPTRQAPTPRCRACFALNLPSRLPRPERAPHQPTHLMH